MMFVWVIAYDYYCRYCGAGPFHGDADLYAHIASSHPSMPR